MVCAATTPLHQESRHGLGYIPIKVYLKNKQWGGLVQLAQCGPCITCQCCKTCFLHSVLVFSGGNKLHPQCRLAFLLPPSQLHWLVLLKTLSYKILAFKTLGFQNPESVIVWVWVGAPWVAIEFQLYLSFITWASDLSSLALGFSSETMVPRPI